MKFTISLDYRVTARDEGPKPTPSRELTLLYVNEALKLAHPGGVSGSVQRMVGRIQRKFDAAVDAAQDEVELDPSEFDEVATAVESATYPTPIAKYVTVLKDYAQAAKAQPQLPEAPPTAQPA
jgi:hypothetical protein